MSKNSKWKEIKCTHYDENERKWFVDAWKTNNPNEEGKVIAKINFELGSLEYLDVDAEEDEYAQEVIKAFFEEMKNK